jgi:beta-glucosidase
MGVQVDLLITKHGTCDSRACAAKSALENGISGEMGGGTYTYLTLPGAYPPVIDYRSQLSLTSDQINNGTVDIRFLDETVQTMLRTKFALGLFESAYQTVVCLDSTLTLPCFADPYPYDDWRSFLRTNETRSLLHTMERESIVLLQNQNVLPLKKSGGSVALIGPQVDRVTVCLTLSD